MQIQDTEAVEEEDEEEEEEKNDDDSQDMFGESQDNLDNPLLGVRPRTVPSHNTISNSRSESRNPFAKKNVEKNTGSLENSPNSGISFDSSAVAQKPLLSRKPLLIPNKKVGNILSINLFQFSKDQLYLKKKPIIALYQFLIFSW